MSDGAPTASPLVGHLPHVERRRGEGVAVDVAAHEAEGRPLDGPVAEAVGEALRGEDVEIPQRRDGADIGVVDAPGERAEGPETSSIREDTGEVVERSERGRVGREDAGARVVLVRTADAVREPGRVLTGGEQEQGSREKAEREVERGDAGGPESAHTEDAVGGAWSVEQAGGSTQTRRP